MAILFKKILLNLARNSLYRGDKLLVGCIYRSPNSTNENNALLLELLKAATNGRHSHVIIMDNSVVCIHRFMWCA